jgi:hypothetical protein
VKRTTGARHGHRPAVTIREKIDLISKPSGNSGQFQSLISDKATCSRSVTFPALELIKRYRVRPYRKPVWGHRHPWRNGKTTGIEIESVVPCVHSFRLIRFQLAGRDRSQVVEQTTSTMEAILPARTPGGLVRDRKSDRQRPRRPLGRTCMPAASTPGQAPIPSVRPSPENPGADIRHSSAGRDENINDQHDHQAGPQRSINGSTWREFCGRWTNRKSWLCFLTANKEIPWI